MLLNVLSKMLGKEAKAEVPPIIKEAILEDITNVDNRKTEYESVKTLLERETRGREPQLPITTIISDGTAKLAYYERKLGYVVCDQGMQSFRDNWITTNVDPYDNGIKSQHLRDDIDWTTIQSMPCACYAPLLVLDCQIVKLLEMMQRISNDPDDFYEEVEPKKTPNMLLQEAELAGYDQANISYNSAKGYLGILGVLEEGETGMDFNAALNEHILIPRRIVCIQYVIAGKIHGAQDVLVNTKEVEGRTVDLQSQWEEFERKYAEISLPSGVGLMTGGIRVDYPQRYAERARRNNEPDLTWEKAAEDGVLEFDEANQLNAEMLYKEYEILLQNITISDEESLRKLAGNPNDLAHELIVKVCDEFIGNMWKYFGDLLRNHHIKPKKIKDKAKAKKILGRVMKTRDDHNRYLKKTEAIENAENNKESLKEHVNRCKVRVDTAIAKRDSFPFGLKRTAADEYIIILRKAYDDFQDKAFDLSQPWNIPDQYKGDWHRWSIANYPIKLIGPICGFEAMLEVICELFESTETNAWAAYYEHEEGKLFLQINATARAQEHLLKAGYSHKELSNFNPKKLLVFISGGDRAIRRLNKKEIGLKAEYDRKKKDREEKKREENTEVSTEVKHVSGNVANKLTRVLNGKQEYIQDSNGREVITEVVAGSAFGVLTALKAFSSGSSSTTEVLNTFIATATAVMGIIEGERYREEDITFKVIAAEIGIPLATFFLQLGMIFGEGYLIAQFGPLGSLASWGAVPITSWLSRHLQKYVIRRDLKDEDSPDKGLTVKDFPYLTQILVMPDADDFLIAISKPGSLFSKKKKKKGKKESIKKKVKKGEALSGLHQLYKLIGKEEMLDMEGTLQAIYEAATFEGENVMQKELVRLIRIDLQKKEAKEFLLTIIYNYGSGEARDVLGEEIREIFEEKTKKDIEKQEEEIRKKKRQLRKLYDEYNKAFTEKAVAVEKRNAIPEDTESNRLQDKRIEESGKITVAEGKMERESESLMLKWDEIMDELGILHIHCCKLYQENSYDTGNLIFSGFPQELREPNDPNLKPDPPIQGRINGLRSPTAGDRLKVTDFVCEPESKVLKIFEARPGTVRQYLDYSSDFRTTVLSNIAKAKQKAASTPPPPPLPSGGS